MEGSGNKTRKERIRRAAARRRDKRNARKKGKFKSKYTPIYISSGLTFVKGVGPCGEKDNRKRGSDKKLSGRNLKRLSRASVDPRRKKARSRGQWGKGEKGDLALEDAKGRRSSGKKKNWIYNL